MRRATIPPEEGPGEQDWECLPCDRSMMGHMDVQCPRTCIRVHMLPQGAHFCWALCMMPCTHTGPHVFPCSDDTCPGPGCLWCFPESYWEASGTERVSLRSEEAEEAEAELGTTARQALSTRAARMLRM